MSRRNRKLGTVYKWALEVSLSLGWEAKTFWKRCITGSLLKPFSCFGDVKQRSSSGHVIVWWSCRSGITQKWFRIMSLMYMVCIIRSHRLGEMYISRWPKHYETTMSWFIFKTGWWHPPSNSNGCLRISFYNRNSCRCTIYRGGTRQTVASGDRNTCWACAMDVLSSIRYAIEHGHYQLWSPKFVPLHFGKGGYGLYGKPRLA